ncbi:TetR/AcrR family transcriptional regulator [Kribbella sp. NPDC050241]|uniref:TetR/AcrR family transcriptional regulator n=1 Tax=Kribbella sp. NPDC050241 TaxID=3364115 RepID=UPI0037A98B96
MRTRRSSDETRAHVLEIAHELFYWQGIRAIGVDRIAAEAGIAPTTLYRLFASKDDLVAAYVDRAYEAYREWFRTSLERGGDDPRDRVLALFSGQNAMLQPDICRGCPFLMVLTEFPDEKLAGHQRAIQLKEWVRDQFVALANDLEVDDPDQLAAHLTLIFEGAYASVQALGSVGPAAQARPLVESLLK